jgi:hypothetical protein
MSRFLRQVPCFQQGLLEKEDMSDSKGLSNIAPDLWLNVGRGQAFGVVANGCYAAQAQCLKQLRDSGEYKMAKLTWKEFCDRYVGLSNRQADRLIAQLEEFGETYFRLSELVQISPRAYRRLAAAGVVKDDTIDIGGELVPITPENGPRIKAALTTLRRDLEAAKRRKACLPFPSVEYLESELQLWTDGLAEILYSSGDGRATVRAQVLLDFAIQSLNSLREASRTRGAQQEEQATLK